MSVKAIIIATGTTAINANDKRPPPILIPEYTPDPIRMEMIMLCVKKYGRTAEDYQWCTDSELYLKIN